MNFVILCPYLAKTGGPEALHQLGNAFSELGVKSQIWYTLNEDKEILKDIKSEDLSITAIKFTDRNLIPDDYLIYNPNIAEEIIISAETVIVIPESMLDWVKYFRKNKILIWWLSVDNSFKTLAPSIINSNELRLNNVFHAYQSEYARNFLKSMQFERTFPLSDYTITRNVKATNKSKICISAIPKVIFNTNYIAEYLKKETGLDIVFIKGLTRDQVYKAFEESYCYIDLGNFPGKDRMTREAALCGCIPIVLNVGGCEYNIPSSLKIEISQINSIPFITKTVIENYSDYMASLNSFIFDIKSEKVNFIKEVAKISNSF